MIRYFKRGLIYYMVNQDRDFVSVMNLINNHTITCGESYQYKDGVEITYPEFHMELNLAYKRQKDFINRLLTEL